MTQDNYAGRVGEKEKEGERGRKSWRVGESVRVGERGEKNNRKSILEREGRRERGEGRRGWELGYRRVDHKEGKGESRC